jgi:hypothetical protein
VTLPASFVDDQGFSFPVDPEPIMFTSGVSGGLCKGGSTIQDGGLESLLVKGE